MVDLSLNNAVKELSKYFRLYSLDELVDQGLKIDSSFSAQVNEFSNLNPDVYSKLLSILVETQKGSLLSKDLVKEIGKINDEYAILNGLSGQPLYHNVVIPYYEDVSYTGLPSISEILAHPEIDSVINNNPSDSTKDTPTMSVYQVKTIRINPTNKSTNAVSLFMNTIPTFEWARSVPYLNIQFQLARPNISNGRINSLSLVKFLEGSKQSGEVFADSILAGSTSNSIDPLASGSSGMELFISPQSLVNATPNQDLAFRATPVIDPFRPFASLKSFNVEVVPAPGIMSYRTGKLSFIIHDRSRLHEIADFIKPDQFNSAEILIEYGWSHPDNTSVFGEFINALKVKEKYMVKNNSFAIKQNGEVAVDLELYTKGANEIYTNNVSTDGNVVKVQEEIQRLQDRVKSLRLRVYKQDEKYTKEIRGTQILSSASDSNSDLMLSRSLRNELRKTLTSLGRKGLGDDAKELKKALEELYGKNGTDGTSKTLRDSIASAINRKIERIKGKYKTDDPFVYADIPPDQKTKQLLKTKNTDKTYVSLAKLFLIFMGEPLCSTNRFDDVQILFYTFNKNAGVCHDKNLGAFLIDIDVFRQKYQKITTLRRTADLNVRDFVDFVTTSFVDDPSSINYGMSDLFTTKPNKETGGIVIKPKIKDATLLNSKQEELMKQAGVEDGIFKMPILDVFVECVPATTNEEKKTTEENNAKTVLRVHIFDKVASSYSTQGELLAAIRDNNISTVGYVPIVDDGDEATLKQRQEAQKIIDTAISRDLIEESPPGSNVYQVKGGINKLKEFISNTMPSIIFGANNSSVTELGLKSMTDDRLSTINMLRTSDGSPLQPNGVSRAGIPMRTMPSQLDLSCRGCPIIEYAQTMFIDCQTGTTLDNLYAIIGISHNIDGNGSFKTSLKFTPLDAYGSYESLSNKVNSAIKITSQFIDEEIEIF